MVVPSFSRSAKIFWSTFCQPGIALRKIAPEAQIGNGQFRSAGRQAERSERTGVQIARLGVIAHKEAPSENMIGDIAGGRLEFRPRKQGCHDMRHSGLLLSGKGAVSPYECISASSASGYSG